MLVIPTDPLLGEKHRAPVIQLDDNGQYRHGKSQQDQRNQADAKIQKTLDFPIQSLGGSEGDHLC
jgi:hypothetical protein